MPFMAGDSPTAESLDESIVDVNATVNVTPSISQYTGSTYTNLTNASMSYDKGSSNTRLVVLVMFTGWAQGTLGTGTFMQVEYAVQVDGNDYVAGYYNFNTASDHRQLAGGAVIPGIAAGTKTLQVRVRRVAVGSGGTAGLTCDSNDRATIVVFETPPA